LKNLHWPAPLTPESYGGGLNRAHDCFSPAEANADALVAA
jgi:hypothetical protein